jgi:hypothetical protein
MERAAASAASGQGGGVRDVADLGEITPETLKKTFPQWRVFRSGGAWWATRGGMQQWSGPESLLLRVITAPNLIALAERLCLQEWLDGLDPDELASVYRDTTLPEAAG